MGPLGFRVPAVIRTTTQPTATKTFFIGVDSEFADPSFNEVETHSADTMEDHMQAREISQERSKVVNGCMVKCP